MHLLNDFFLLSWNENSDLIEDSSDELSKDIYLAYEASFREFCESCSIIFIINSENFEKIIQIEEFRFIFRGLFRDRIIEKCLILQVQKKVLELIIELGNLELNRTLKENFEILRKEGIITYYISRRLIGLFALIKDRTPKVEQIHLQVAKKDKNFYKSSINLLKTSILNLSACIESEALKQRVVQVNKKIEEERFSIGVTGVINAGKSTMLNALLKEEILGTAVVPETANLSILKYSKERQAKVNFWTKEEFSKIEESAKDIQSIKKFVDETKKSFKNSLGEYITQEGRSENIDIEDLILYTSAEKSNKKCNLIKSVELYSDLEFLKDGVEIVDTPGLDDPIIQREEITLQYVSECDLMMHLMNVNQSATQKDIDFIIDSILYQNIARLLIVITRIDTVSKEELDEVVSYTKTSIQNRLKEQNQSYKFEYIIQKIEFISVSGKMALLLRTGEEELAKSKGYDLEKSGILKVEGYLESVLFGSKSQKAQLIIQSNKNELQSIIEQAKSSLKEEELLLGKTNLEIKEEYKKFQSERDEMFQALFEIKKTINSQEKELKEYFKFLHKFLYDKLVSIKDIVKSRVIDDVSYEMRKNKKIPKKERIDYIVEIALKDGLVDLIREYRYEFEKRMQDSFDAIMRKLRIELPQKENNSFDSQDFFEKNFKTLRVFQNRSVLLAKIYEAIELYAKKSSQKLDIVLSEILEKTIHELQELLMKKIEKTDVDLLDNFIGINQKKVLTIEEEVKAKEKMLKNIMRGIKNSSVDKKQRIDEIKSKNKALKIIERDLEVLNESA